LKKPALLPAFLLLAADRCCQSLENAVPRINSVDGFHWLLEIGYRSAYVPNAHIGV
jgi:hypothetical protein